MPIIPDVADEIEVLCTSPARANMLGGHVQQPVANTWCTLFLLVAPVQSPSSSRSVARRQLLQIVGLQG